jgi:hypothetical protein
MRVAYFLSRLECFLKLDDLIQKLDLIYVLVIMSVVYVFDLNSLNPMDDDQTVTTYQFHELALVLDL